ncbi:hypothetical protein ACIQU5_27985 [Streptomyces sp. NPDC090306]|uniref:hypothetical protein n=1 Tax=Streptomyces sp. NPDC090306 TaxID=3365961 RepID=UPI00380841F9
MNVQLNRPTEWPITVEDFLNARGLPEWQYRSPLGCVAADIYRREYRRDPGREWQWINGRWVQVFSYLPAERHVLTQAWEAFGEHAGPPAPRPVRHHRPEPQWHGSGDAMRWQPGGSGPLRSHP